ncbi:putative bifunctional diguanylate cyclase/phosphodiesterase [Millisia brevis]|uniref:putative bifunctional diguanylate cyclase/phosphodiesterase n=1 Tax=Millisia brevis TaxID=264148 RepID=UPI0009FD8943|nr:EAL domain-containing protein [Millisia brevis]
MRGRPSETTPVRRLVIVDGDVRWCDVPSVDVPTNHALVRMLGGVTTDAEPHPVDWPLSDGSRVPVVVTAHRLVGSGGDAVLYEIDAPSDDGDDLDQHQQWRLSRLEALTKVGTWTWDLSDNSVSWSEALLRLFGLPEGISLDYPTYRSMLHPDDVPTIEQTLDRALAEGTPFSYTHRMFLADLRSERVFECYGEVITDNGRPIRVLGTAQDITEQHRARAQLAYLADHDPLTGLSNRRRITDRVADCAARDHGGALLLIDVDHFKDINDLRGHAAGDQVMRTLAQRLADEVEPDMLLGRLGGDEFAVVLPGWSIEAAAGFADRLCRVISGPAVVIEDSTLHITASIGVADIAPGSDYEVTVARADLALYKAKDAGRNRARVFASNHYDEAAHRVSVLQRVATALDEGAMRLHVQPILALDGWGPEGPTTVAHEVLIRLADDVDPPMGPADFLPAAERTDLILRLDRWVIEQAVAALATPQARRRALRLDVNISGRSVADPELGDWILGVLARSGVEPYRLGVEITETAAIASVDAARKLATTLVTAGCGFALDDFGAGFGSFSHLKHLPFTAVKIDGEFIAHVDTDPVDRALVESVVMVARRLGMQTVAERVDREALVTTLRALGIDQAQGFHLGRPVPLADLLRVLESDEESS